MIEINGIDWYLKFVNPNDIVLRTPNNLQTLGVCDNITKTIYLASNLKGAMLKHVLCHELVHAAMFSYGILLDYEQEELVANLIATYGEEIIIKTNEIFKRLS